MSNRGRIWRACRIAGMENRIRRFVGVLVVLAVSDFSLDFPHRFAAGNFVAAESCRYQYWGYGRIRWESSRYGGDTSRIRTVSCRYGTGKPGSVSRLATAFPIVSHTTPTPRGVRPYPYPKPYPDQRRCNFHAVRLSPSGEAPLCL